MRPEQDDAELLLHAAISVSDTMLDVMRLGWPGCPTHDGFLMSSEYVDADAELWWICRRGAHPEAPVGRLTRQWNPAEARADS
jgi:hypothetical protein